jgi:integrase
MRDVGIEVSPHQFRHHFSHAWLDHGGAEGDLMELNGWASPQMLRRYGASARSARARRSYDRPWTTRRNPAHRYQAAGPRRPASLQDQKARTRACGP